MGAFFGQDEGENNENPIHIYSIAILLLNARYRT